MGDVVKQLIYKNRRLRVEAGVRLIAEEVARIQGDGAGNSHALLHAAGNLRGVFGLGALKIYTLQTEACAIQHFIATHIGKHHQRKHDIAKHGFRIEQSRPLKQHSDFLAQLLHLVDLRADVVENSLPVERFSYIPYLNHCSRSLVSSTSNRRIRILLETTAFVLAFPTSRAPPFT